MTEAEYHHKSATVEQLLNDPEVAMDAHLVWSLLDEIAGAEQQDSRGTAPAQRM